MKISILSWDLSHNCLGRAYLLAKILQKRYDVEIIGPTLEGDIWKPVKEDNSIRYKIIKNKFNIRNILNLINGDIIYAIKPKGTSFGYGLLKKLSSKKPLILDIDDWELSFFLSNWKFFLFNLAHFWDINNLLSTFLFERFTKYANAITVSNSFLQKRFGGTIITHVKDTDLVNPHNYDKQQLKKKMSLGNKKIIMFFGTIRKHKGVDDLISAFEKLKKNGVVLMFVGADFEDNYVKKLMKENNKNIRFIRRQPIEKMPEFLSVSDIIVIPQKYSKSYVGQMPAKLFDAMAMAKPIISTNVSDIPKVLKGCGIVIKPNNPKELANKIGYLLNNPIIAKELGRKAREKCVKEYSFNYVGKKLFKIIEELKIKNDK